MKNNYTFISYQTEQKNLAGKVQRLLNGLSVKSFLAHEDIEVSQEWRIKILEELKKADIFICLLSKEYYESPWCVQESGIAAYKEDTTIIPFSVDGEIPKGFISNYQSAKLVNSPMLLDPLSVIELDNLIPGLLRHDLELGINAVITLIGESKSFRGAEVNFKLILPYEDKLNNIQAVKLLNVTRKNKQVYDAMQCAKEYIPPLLTKYGHLLSKDDLEFLWNICNHHIENA